MPVVRIMFALASLISIGLAVLRKKSADDENKK